MVARMIGGSESCVAATAKGASPTSLLGRGYDILRRLGRVAPLAVAASVLPGVGGLVLYGRLGALAPWLRDHPTAGPVVCAAVFAVAGGLALVPTYAMSVVCGWSFGFGAGLTATLVGFLLAALLGYALGRAADGGRVLTLISRVPKWRAVHEALATGGFGKEVLVVSLVRLAPIAPFSLTNVVMAGAQVRPLPYALGTLLGMTPRTAVLVYAASRVASVDTPVAEQPWLLAIGAAATILVVLALGWIGKKGLTRVTSEAPSGD